MSQPIWSHSCGSATHSRWSATDDDAWRLAAADLGIAMGAMGTDASPSNRRRRPDGRQDLRHSALLLDHAWAPQTMVQTRRIVPHHRADALLALFGTF